MKTLKDLDLAYEDEEDLRDMAKEWIKILELKEAWNWYNLKGSGHCMARNVRASDKPDRKLTKEEDELIFGITPHDGILLLQKFFNIKRRVKNEQRN